MTTVTTETTDTDDGLQTLVRALGEALYNDPGEKPLPMATTDAKEVIHAQLTENTGTHFLDSGGAYGRHWEENQESPPWEDPTYEVGRGYVVRNVADHMEKTLGRDRTCVALEAALYAFGRTDDQQGEAWLRVEEAFANSLLDGEVTEPILRSMGVPEGFVDDVLAVQSEVEPARTPDFGRGGEPAEAFTVNTYNHEHGALSQVLQGVNLGGPYAEYVFMQVHQGADVRGGYTGPRVYSVWDAWIPSEFWFRCEQCGWDQAESCLYGSDAELLFVRGDDDPAEQLVEEGWLPADEAGADHPALDAADRDYMDGAIFHRCEDDEPGIFGNVRV